MAQYRPKHKAFDHPEISRRITRDEWQQALRWANDAGLTNLDGGGGAPAEDFATGPTGRAETVS